jgi:hypothetical protein
MSVKNTFCFLSQSIQSLQKEKTMQSIAEKIKTRAYDLYVERDGKSGSELGDWLNAEKEIGLQFVASNKEEKTFSRAITSHQQRPVMNRSRKNF